MLQPQPVRRSRRLRGHGPTNAPDPINPPNDLAPSVIVESDADLPDNQQQQPESKQQVKTHVDEDMIPSDVDDDWTGYDTSGLYVIRSDGEIIYDHSFARSGLYDANQRNKRYNQHKRYVVKQVCGICWIFAFFTTSVHAYFT